MNPIQIYGIVQQLAGFLDFLGGGEKWPKLKDEDGNWLPLYYGGQMNPHYRATADDLSKIWEDRHVICDRQTGVPVARWNQGKQKVQPVVGFTVQGLPVYSELVRPRQDPVWTTKRDVPPEAGSPGEERIGFGWKGGTPLLPVQPVQVRRGEKLVQFMGYYGPFEDPIPAPFFPPPPQRSQGGPPGQNPTLSGLLTLGGAVAALSGLWLPAGAMFLLSALGSSPGPSSRGGPGAASTSAGVGLRK